MNATALNLLGWTICGLTGMMFVTCIAAVGLGEWPQAGSFLVSACVSGFFAGALIIGFRGRDERLNRVQVSLLLLAVWLVLPAMSAMPLYAAGGFESIDLAFFEAVSGLTTTGATVIEDLSAVSKTVIFWRAVLQWFGGALSLMAAVLVLAPFGILRAPINITIPGYERDDLGKSIWATGRHIMPTYALLTLACMVLLWLGGIGTFEAFCLAMSSLSTGGFMPVPGKISQYGSLYCEIVLGFFMLVGATSILSHRAVMLRVPGTHLDNVESWYLGVLVLVAGLVLTGVMLIEPEPVGDWTVARYGIFRAVSLITTTGFDNAIAGAGGVPFAVVLALCSIGGASFSTAGGLKVFRALSMATQAHRELKRLIHPRGITRARSAGKSIDIQIMKTIWSLLFVFLAATGVVSVALGAEGVSVGRAVILALSSLSNTGPAIQMTTFDVAGPSAAGLFGQLSSFVLLVLSGAMILGRVEFVVLLSLALYAATRR